MRHETASKRIEEQITRILTSYPKDQVDRVIPVLLLMMERTHGLESLEPRMQQAVLEVYSHMSIERGASAAVLDKKVERYIETLHVNPRILDDIRSVFQIQAAMSEQTPAPSAGRVPELRSQYVAPKVGTPRPSDSVSAEVFTRRATRLIRG